MLASSFSFQKVVPKVWLQENTIWLGNCFGIEIWTKIMPLLFLICCVWWGGFPFLCPSIFFGTYKINFAHSVLVKLGRETYWVMLNLNWKSIWHMILESSNLLPGPVLAQFICSGKKCLWNEELEVSGVGENRAWEGSNVSNRFNISEISRQFK